MKYKFRKGLAVGAVCLLMLVSIPLVSSERIVYPREEGPYTIYVVGFIRGFGFNWQVDFYSYKWPFWCLNYSQKIDYSFEIFSMLLVNGSLQKIKYPANIRLHGFKGFAPTFWMLNLKLYMGRCRVIGKCDELLVYDDL